jgi:hypothetical protein
MWRARFTLDPRGRELFALRAYHPKPSTRPERRFPLGLPSQLAALLSPVSEHAVIVYTADRDFHAASRAR